MTQALQICQRAIVACVEWTERLFSSMEAGNVVLSAFMLCLIVGLFIMPLRGGSVGADHISDMVQQATYNPKHWNGKWVKGNSSYRGKYEARKHGGHRATPKK